MSTINLVEEVCKSCSRSYNGAPPNLTIAVTSFSTKVDFCMLHFDSQVINATN